MKVAEWLRARGIRFWLLFSSGWAALVVVGSLVGFWVDARPTDDLFYVDAAWRLQHGTFAPPSVNAPYHHYLRWPVVVPLAGAMALFGPTETVLRYFPAMIMIVTSALFALIARRLSSRPEAWVAGALTPIFMPLAAPRILSEGVSVLWFAAALAVLAVARPSGNAKATPLLLAGACAALAANAAQVAVFSTPALVVFALALRPRPATFPVFLRTASLAAALLGTGFIAAYAIIVGAEWLAFGDPLVQVKAILGWHMKTVSPLAKYGAAFFDPSNRGFILGLTRGLIFQAPMFMVLVLCLALTCLRQPTLQGFAPPLLAALVALITLEIFSPLVVDKLYVRFAAIPVALAFFSLSAAAATSLARHSLWTRGLIGAGIGVVLFLHAAEKSVLERDDPLFVRYSAPLRLIESSLPNNLGSDDVSVYYLLPETPGMIGIEWIFNAYTDYRLPGRMRREAPTQAERAPIRFIVTDSQDPAPEWANGAREMQYSHPSPFERPRVFIIRDAP